MFINFIIILHIKNIFHLHIGLCHFWVIFCPVWKRNWGVRCEYFLLGTCSDQHKVIKKNDKSIIQTVTHDQWRHPILGARYFGIPAYRLKQQITPSSPSTSRATDNNTPQPQCGQALGAAGVGANCRSKEASVGWSIMFSCWVVVRAAEKSKH